MADKLINLEKELKLNVKNSDCEKSGDKKSNEDLSKQKLKDLLNTQLETSENFRLNTEKTLNTIKEEFQQMVLVSIIINN